MAFRFAYTSIHPWMDPWCEMDWDTIDTKGGQDLDLYATCKSCRCSHIVAAWDYKHHEYATLDTLWNRFHDSIIKKYVYYDRDKWVRALLTHSSEDWAVVTSTPFTHDTKDWNDDFKNNCIVYGRIDDAIETFYFVYGHHISVVLSLAIRADLYDGFNGSTSREMIRSASCQCSTESPDLPAEIQTA